MDEIFVSWSELENKAMELEGENKRLISECGLYEQNANSLKGSYEGEVAEDFFREAQEHKAKMTAFTDLITKYVETMRTMAANAKKTEAQAKAIVGQKNS